MHRQALCFLLLICAPQPGPAQCRASNPWSEAEALFRQDPRWLGSDGAVSAQIDAATVYWSFDDSFVDLSGSGNRDKAAMVRNSIAIQRGTDPRNAVMSFHWGHGAQGQPGEFYPDRADGWYWTGAALRLPQGPLIQFLWRQVAAPGDGLGFANAGYDLAIIANPDAAVENWQIAIHPGSDLPFDAVPASALILEGEFVLGVALRQAGTHAAALVRYATEDLARGKTGTGEWWTGSAGGWKPAMEIGTGGPAWIIDDAGAENSVHFEPRIGQYLHVATYGFGDATIGIRTAPALTGPWSEITQVYDPPERQRARPFVYAAMAHPELEGPETGALAVSYATNSFEFEELFTPDGQRDLYWPRLVLLNPGCKAGATADPGE